ncbi:MAG: 3-oxoacyl-ACP reductase FabG [Burkholderiales bacterium]
MFNNQVTLITGVSRGIGRAIAVELGKAGATVVGTATSDSAANAIRDYFSKEKITGSAVTLDVNNGDQVQQRVDEIEKCFGPVAILVNNAGITRDNLAVRMKDEEWDAVLSTNITSVFRLSRAVLRGMMKARYGRIINISSVVGAMGNAGQCNYATAKSGMMGFSKALAREVASRNITVNCVAPGFIDTDMTRALPDDKREALLSQIPAARLGRCEDVAAAVRFLASPEAGYITGATLHVNGGLYMN